MSLAFKFTSPFIVFLILSGVESCRYIMDGRDGGTGDAADAVASPILRVGMLASPIFSLTFA